MIWDEARDLRYGPYVYWLSTTKICIVYQYLCSPEDLVILYHADDQGELHLKNWILI